MATTSTLSQENRLLALETPLGKDKLLPVGFSGTEGISVPFEFTLDMISEDDSIKAEDIIGKAVTVTLWLADFSPRYFNGIVSRFRCEGIKGVFSKYSAVIVPAFRLLDYRSDCRLLKQEADVKEIMEEVFSAAGFTDYTLKLSQKYRKREFTVQYNETDFNFLCRLMEDEGIGYFFRHEKGKHTLVLFDDASAHDPCPKQDSVDYSTADDGHLESDVVKSFHLTSELRSAEFAVNDYDFKNPSASLLASTTSSIPYKKADLKRYEYPANYVMVNEGTTLAKVRMETDEARHAHASGSSTCRAFASGYKFDLQRAGNNLTGTYVLTAITHAATDGSYRSKGGGEMETSYSNTFSCMPYKVPFRPRRTAYMPLIPGAQTAIVVGEQNDEIMTDEHGRVKVRFHWQRDETKMSSCWIRVGQIWASKGYGAVFLPRVGDEVIVEFLEGNPDRPLITGKVYHGTNMPPYKLPDEKTRSTIKSNTSPGGQGFNEIRFEDAKDKEQVFIHGQRNLDIQVKNDMFETVGNNSNIVVKKDRLVTVEQNLEEKIMGKLTETVEKDAEITINGNEVRKVKGTLSIICEKSFTEDYKDDCSIKSVKMITLHGKDVVIEADANITLKVGGSSIVIANDGITIKTAGNMEIKGGAQTNVSGPMVSVKGDGQATLESGGQTVVKGPLVMIN